MDSDRALAALPEVYAEALRLRGLGLGSAEIADRLGVAESAIGSLLRLATAKFARLREDPE